VLESSLPAGAFTIYSDGAGGATVVDIPFGDGSITLLGWDWFDSNPPNSTVEAAATAHQRGGGGPFDGGWQLLFKDSVQLADLNVPTVSVAGVRRACVAKSANVRFNINAPAGVASVRVTLDGKRVVSTTKSRFTVKVNARKLKAGRHRLVAVVTDKAGNRTTVRRTVSTCAAAKPRRQTGPRFTG
jgi:hypothetical protein